MGGACVCGENDRRIWVLTSALLTHKKQKSGGRVTVYITHGGSRTIGASTHHRLKRQFSFECNRWPSHSDRRNAREEKRRKPSYLH